LAADNTKQDKGEKNKDVLRHRVAIYKTKIGLL